MWVRLSTYERLQQVADNIERIANESLAINKRLMADNDVLRTKLARYTAPRQRDAKGHFLPLDRVQA